MKACFSLLQTYISSSQINSILFYNSILEIVIEMMFTLLLVYRINWASMRENLSLRFANIKGADQPAHPCRLISTVVIRFLKSIRSKLATGEMAIF